MPFGKDIQRRCSYDAAVYVMLDVTNVGWSRSLEGLADNYARQAPRLRHGSTHSGRRNGNAVLYLTCFSAKLERILATP
jgi:hypothetical protein